jgi:hypothetical protein
MVGFRPLQTGALFSYRPAACFLCCARSLSIDRKECACKHRRMSVYGVSLAIPRVKSGRIHLSGLCVTRS